MTRTHNWDIIKGKSKPCGRYKMEQSKLQALREAARQIRIGVIKSTNAAKSGHPGGSLSIADILAYLYFEEMNIDPANPQDPMRDRFVLSKGHCAPGLYSALANRGYFPVEELTTLRKIGARLQGHPDMTLTPGVDMSAGSLGLGISSAAGMALAGKIDGKDYLCLHTKKTKVGNGKGGKKDEVYTVREKGWIYTPEGEKTNYYLPEKHSEEYAYETIGDMYYAVDGGEFIDNCPCEIRPEEPINAQELYSILDSCIQEVLSNENADVVKVLEKANADFALAFYNVFYYIIYIVKFPLF